MTRWKFALRSLTRRPGFSLTALALLALGTGVDTALFSLVDTMLLRPLPFPDAAQLVTVLEANSAGSQKESLLAPVRIEDWNRLNRTFTAIAGAYSESVTDTSEAEPERLSGLRVSPRYFAVYGMQPRVGRTFTAAEEQTGGSLAAAISYGLWTRRYGQDRNITSRRLVIDGKGYSIAGVMPKEFASAAIDLWIPAQTPPFLMQLRNARFYSGIGRMKPGVRIAQAQADLASVQQALGEQFPKTDKGWSASLRHLKDARVGDWGRQLMLLFGAVTLLLLITVTSVASLVLAQLHQRERELAIRASIGATRGQVVAAVMREVLLIALAGALGGWAVASSATTLLMKFFAAVPRIVELRTDWRALSFVALISLLGAAAFGLLPALRATGARRAGSLFRAGQGIVGSRPGVQRALVACQIAVTMVLLSSTGLLLRSFHNLSHVELGFQASHTVLFHVGAAWNENRTRVGRLQERLLSELARLPGVEAAGMTNFLPVSGATLRYQVSLEGALGSEETSRMPAGSRTVSPGYLKTLRVPLLAGDWCPELRANLQAPPKVMVNRRFVEVYAHGEGVVGRHLRQLDFGPASPAAEIVGVIGDVKEDAFEAPVYPYVYNCAVAGGWPDPEYVVRTSADPRALMSSIRQLVRGIDPARAVFGVEMLEEELDRTLDRPRTNARMLGLFAMAAMTLAAVGLYGLVTHIVGARRREIGLRMALGAEPARIVQSVMAGAARLIGAGMACGLGLTVAAQRALRSVLFGVSPFDAASLAGAAVLLGAVSALAAFLPARRAAAIDPVESMRVE